MYTSKNETDQCTLTNGNVRVVETRQDQITMLGHRFRMNFHDGAERDQAQIL